jgi:RNA polymerase II subunit A-like phosphatase
MTHSANGPTVSLEEARRIEQETAAHLLKSQKLTLIVDLDQTIVHATVDPTVGDWISEGEAWEARQAKRRAEVEVKVKAEADANGDVRVRKNGLPARAVNGGGKEANLSSGFEPDPNDEVNPNWEALKDVKKFRLGPEAFLPPTGIRPSGSRKGKERAIENEGCLYYVKPRCVPVVLSHDSTHPLVMRLQTRVEKVPRPRIHKIRNARLHDGHQGLR